LGGSEFCFAAWVGLDGHRHVKIVNVKTVNNTVNEDGLTVKGP
jgi:hypothetical protein